MKITIALGQACLKSVWHLCLVSKSAEFRWPLFGGAGSVQLTWEGPPVAFLFTLKCSDSTITTTSLFHHAVVLFWCVVVCVFHQTFLRTGNRDPLEKAESDFL